MSMAIIVQREANTVPGGSLRGFLTGTDSGGQAGTFYGRRLTNMIINESSGGVPTVSSFTASTGGNNAVSTAGQFVLVPGTYRISVRAVYNGLVGVNSTTFIMGLFNVTSNAFEVYSGDTTPILGTPSFTSAGSNALGNQMFIIEAGFTVSTTNKTFSLQHEGRDAASPPTSTNVNSLFACGYPTTMTGANVNSAAAQNTYCWIKLLKTA